MPGQPSTRGRELLPVLDLNLSVAAEVGPVPGGRTGVVDREAFLELFRAVGEEGIAGRQRVHRKRLVAFGGDEHERLCVARITAGAFKTYEGSQVDGRIKTVKRA